MPVTQVAHLKKLLADVPDNAWLVVPASDHTYQRAEVEIGTALYDLNTQILSEDYGEETTPEAEYGKRIPVVLFR